MRATLFIVLFLSCAVWVSADDVSKDFQAAVEAGVKSFNEGVGAKDSARIGAIYANDAIAFPPNSEAISGRESIQNFWKGFIDSGMGGKVETVSLEDDDDFGIEVGTYLIQDAAGNTVDQGKYVVVWKKDDGKWHMYRDIWNSNMPLPGASK